MEIKWTKETELTMTTEYDENFDMTETQIETAYIDECDECDIIKDESDIVDIQFADGSVAFGVPKKCFEIISD